MFLTKTKQGFFIPSSDLDRDLSQKIGVGTEVKATAARNVKFHRKAYALLNLGFENQNLTDNFEVYRKLKTIQAGFFDRTIDKYGAVHELPHSLSFEKMSAESFEKWFNATIEVISSDMLTASDIIKSEVEAFY